MNKTKLLTASISFAAALAFAGCAASNQESNTHSHHHMQKGDVLSSYAKIAKANYNDALNDAKALQRAIENFANNTNENTFQAAKDAWLVSRESYGQTEIFRLANGPIDAEDGWVADTYGSLEGQLNAWPLDENMIDYTVDANGAKTSGNIIDTTGKFNPGG